MNRRQFLAAVAAVPLFARTAPTETAGSVHTATFKYWRPTLRQIESAQRKIYFGSIMGQIEAPNPMLAHIERKAAAG